MTTFTLTREDIALLADIVDRASRMTVKGYMNTVSLAERKALKQGLLVLKRLERACERHLASA